MLVIAGAASMFLYAIDKSTFFRLMYDPLSVRDGEVWRLVTWPIANPPTQIWVVFTLLFFWFVGHAVEELVGRNRFAVLVAVVTVLPAVIVTALPYRSFPTVPEIGLGLVGTAMLTVFAAEHPHAPFFFGVPAWVIAIVFVGIEVLRVVGDRYWGTLVLMVAAIVLALVIVRQWGFAQKLAWIPSVKSGKPHPPRRGPAPKRPTTKRPNAPRGGNRVVEGPWSAPLPPMSSAEAAAAQVELDALLDKISATGLESLTSDEKRRLNELSKRLR
jgi:membrane associated rhomboid family serine protease